MEKLQMTNKIITAICPICGKEYKYREEYFMKNVTCPSRDCKNKYQERQRRELQNIY